MSTSVTAHQVEEHLNPTCAGQPFVLFLPGRPHQHQHRPPLGVSAAARRAGVGPGATVAQLYQRFGQGQGQGDNTAVRFIPAASWAGLGQDASGDEEAVLEAYRRVAAQGPMTLVSKIVAGDGLALQAHDGDGNNDGLGEGYVAVPSAGGAGSEQQAHEEALARARDLGGFLQSEVKLLLSYQLKVGVGSSLDDARREARGLLVFRRRAAAGAAAAADGGDGGGSGSSGADMPPPPPRPPARSAAAPPAEPAAGSSDGEDPQEQEQDEPGVEVAEYRCEACGGLFFAATDLLAHVEARHGGNGKRRRRHRQRQQQQQQQQQQQHPGEAGTASVPLGPGRYRATEVLASLTDAGAIAAFLQEAGAPVVKLGLGPSSSSSSSS